MRILVVDDEEIKRVSLVDDLTAADHDATPAVNGQEALDLLIGERFDVVLTDLRMPDIDGMALLRQIKDSDGPHPAVILMTAYGSIPIAVEAMKMGAYDFVTKPFRNQAILPILSRIEDTLSATLQGETPEDENRSVTEQRIVGTAAAMQAVRKMVLLCSRTDATVLLTGETGVGKDLVADTIHNLSSRRARPFVKVNCAVFPQHLIESELYGHEKGAFTGADQLKKGKVDLAQGGTLYLDDVDDIPPTLQIKLLSLIEEKFFERVGGSKRLQADVRIIASTKQDLLAKTADGTFRSDLYYRLNVMRIDIPPLRDRLDDLPPLAEHLLGRGENGSEIPLDRDALRLLASHSWPGNVRELAHALGRASLLGDGAVTAEALSADLTPQQQVTANGGGDFHDTILRTEQELLAGALREAGGNRSAAARTLGMKLSTFRDKLTKHGLD
ncbi:MAG: sigma-54 dependent transcriptional regulator [Phycisphaerae bacterium]|jgi:DNA-binding NtrC family response regulator|nr:sigma-54 dependent transcriptional regulator [Phycisphaerae bacterium]